jgi:hypothetical protein
MDQKSGFIEDPDSRYGKSQVWKEMMNKKLMNQTSRTYYGDQSKTTDLKTVEDSSPDLTKFGFYNSPFSKLNKTARETTI